MYHTGTTPRYIRIYDSILSLTKNNSEPPFVRTPTSPTSHQLLTAEMGLCCSCLKSHSSQERETEMTDQNAPKSSSFQFIISRKMSSPSVTVSGLTVKGEGLALIDVSIEQDAAYWEWHVTADHGKVSSDDDNYNDEDLFNNDSALKFGVATKKNREFYNAIANMSEHDDDVNVDDGTKLMRGIFAGDGDTIGVAVQQGDLPMVQFLLNGEPMHEIAISRFRGMVFPSVHVKAGFTVKFIWDEDEFKEMSPHVRFGPLIPERGLI
jgi:hypothetical protein